MTGAHKLVDMVRLGLHSLTVHVVRSVLTAVGIIIGVCSVIIMLAVNEGASYKAQQTLRLLGSNNIIINTVKLPEDESRVTASHGIRVRSYGLTHADVARLTGSVPNIQRCVVVHRTLKDSYVRGKTLTVAVIATDPTYILVARTEILAGRFISSVDMLRSKPHCVVTQSLARRLFGYKEPLGRIISIQGEPFIVVGILGRLPATLAGRADDVGSNVIIPLTTNWARFGRVSIRHVAGSFSAEKVEVSQIILQMTDEKAVLEGAAIAKSLLDRYHEEEDYETVVPLELIAQREEQMRLWNIMSVVIAAISLVVGGIGIMNIMLASVTERTREIGVRRALGAKRRDIVVQFLVESVTLTAVGGLIGIGLGLLLPWAVERWLEFTTIITPTTLLLPFAMAVVVGLASGLYPALRAARLDPITALRHE